MANVDAIRSSLHDAQSHFATSFGDSRTRTEREYTWNPPPADWVKLNIDGAFSHFTAGVACGGVLRDAHGNFLKGFMFKGMDGDSLSAELWGCLHGLKQAWDLGYRQVILESDSADSVDLMKKGLNDLHTDRTIIAEIQQLLGRDWKLEVRLISRWANTVADHLAKVDLPTMQGFHVVTDTDPELHRLLVMDMG